ncbi:MAG: hypothetical protein QOG63_1726 [Thermoleophilaceae bacterium]|nr:hypothetical protein [Thermoleophilaceae bacterium]
MPDDRFADLGAGERLAELDRHDDEARPEPPRRRGRYTWVVGVAAVIAIVVVAINSLPHAARGSDGPAVGKPLPRFAAPNAARAQDLDPNINQDASDPAPGKTPACEVPPDGAVRSCDYTSKPLVLTFIAPTSSCEDYLDRVERMRARFPRVNFVAVLSAANEGKAASIVKQHGWTEPVALDRNGSILTLNRVSFCPTVVIAGAGGIVRQIKEPQENWTDAQLAAAIRRVR